MNNNNTSLIGKFECAVTKDQPKNSNKLLVLWLWRFLLAGNFDALLLVAWVAVFHVGDLKIGLGLLHRGAKRGCIFNV